MVEAIFNGRVIGASENTVVIEGNHYFPPGDVDPQFLRKSRLKTLCPWKGIASYYTVEVDGIRDPYAAWTYRHPLPFARRIKNHIAFWGHVQVLEPDSSPAR